MLQLKTKRTNRKFYNKWLYKVSLNVPGVGFLRNHSLEYIIEFCNTDLSDHRQHSLASKAWHNRDQLIKLVSFLSSYNSELWSKRIEHNLIDIYTNDIEFYNKLSKEFEQDILHRFEPPAGLTDLLDQPQIIISKKLPHNKYRHKVYLLPHKMAGEKEEKKRYIEWLKLQRPRITCTPAIESWFVKTDWNWDRRYILVEDEHTLLMLKLRNSSVVGRIYNYIISDK